MRAINLAMHQATKLEEDYVQLKIDGKGKVDHIHPIIDLAGDDFDFTPELVSRVMADAESQTIAWLSQPHDD